MHVHHIISAEQVRTLSRERDGLLELCKPARVCTHTPSRPCLADLLWLSCCGSIVTAAWSTSGHFFFMPPLRLCFGACALTEMRRPHCPTHARAPSTRSKRWHATHQHACPPQLWSQRAIDRKTAGLDGTHRHSPALSGCCSATCPATNTTHQHPPRSTVCVEHRTG